MKTETKIIIFLLLLPPVLGELLSGSTPPLAFFNPFSLIILTFLYGCGTLLIREARTRWNLQWSVLFLVIAYGILEEGIMMQSFFNTTTRIWEYCPVMACISAYNGPGQLYYLSIMRPSAR